MPKLTFERVLIIGVFFLASLVVMFPQTSDPDLYWHLRSGDIMIENRAVIYGDLFSHTLPGVFRPHHEWLTEVMLSGLYRVMADYGVTLAATVCAMAALILMYRLSTGSVVVRLVMVLLVANITTTTALARPQGWMLVFTIILVGMMLKRNSRTLFWIPLMMAAWVNLHGGWITGYIVLGAAVTSEVIRLVFRRGGDIVWLRRLILWSLVSILALLINPYGFEQLLVPLKTFNLASRPYLNEWRPPDLLAFNRIAFPIMLALNLLVVAKYYRRISLLEAFLLGGFALWALTTTRIVLMYTFIAPIMLTPYLSEWISQIAPRLTLREDVLRRPVRLGLPLVVVMGLAAVLLFLNGSRPDRIRELKRVSYPADAVAFLKQSNAPRELFNTDNWGGYLIYYLPEYPVFVDTRTDLYADFFLTYYSIITVQDGWEEKLADYDVQTILIGKTRELTDALRADSDWEIIYEDDIAVIFQKVTAA